MRIQQEYELVKIDGDVDVLEEHPRNPRRGDVEAIDESIEANGWYGAITAQKSTGYILAGNHRFRAASARGASEVPVVWLDVDDAAALRILLADNRTADLGTYDEELLAELLAGLETLDGTGYGLAAAEAAEEAPEPEPDDEEVPADKYEPSYGIMMVCDDEADQEMMYEWLQERLSESGFHNKLRVVAT